MKDFGRLMKIPKIVSAALILFSISLVGVSSVTPVGAMAIGTACTEASVVSQINSIHTDVSTDSAINLAQSASQYEAVTDGSAASFSGISNGWAISPVTCAVSWQDLAVNFYMKAANGSAYTVSVTENPKVGVVSDVTISPAISASISVGHGISYSGYGIAGSDANPLPQLYQAEAYFYQPTVSMPPASDRGAYTCDIWTGSSWDYGLACYLAAWAGLADSKYTGPGSVSSGGVVQTGTFGEVENNSLGHSVTVTYYAWSEDFESSNSNNAANLCPAGDTPSPSQDFTANVENQLVANGTSGSNYYTYLTDWGGYWVCSHHYSDSFTPVYANFIAERPGNSSTTVYSLPDFTSFNFYYDAMYYGSFTGVYSYYTNGYGFGVEMYNGGNYDTYTSAMSQIGSGYGNFTETYHSSLGT